MGTISSSSQEPIKELKNLIYYCPSLSEINEYSESRTFGYLKGYETLTPKQIKYVHNVLGDNGVRDLLEKNRSHEILLCAYAKRVMNDGTTSENVKEKRTHKGVLRVKFAAYFIPRKLAHMGKIQHERWGPEMRWAAGTELKHDPSLREYNKWYADHMNISEEFRPWYFWMAPGMVKINEKYCPTRVSKNIESELSRIEKGVFNMKIMLSRVA